VKKKYEQILNETEVIKLRILVDYE